MSWLSDLLKKLFGGGDTARNNIVSGNGSRTETAEPAPPPAPAERPAPQVAERQPPPEAPSPSAPVAAPIPPRPSFSRSMYVDVWHTRYRDGAALERLGSYCAGREITELHLYDLHRILTGSSNQDAHHRAVETLKTHGITRFNAAYSAVEQLGQIGSHQGKHGDFTGTILEFEWWNEGPRDFAGALSRLRAAADLGLEVLAYVGWLEADEIDDLTDLVDVLHLHAYRPTGNDTFEYTRPRLELLQNREQKFVPIFSAEGNFMEAWLRQEGMAAAERLYEVGYDGWNHPATATLTKVGFNYFRATEMMEGIGPQPAVA